MAVHFTIRAHQIATLLDRAPAGVEVLSLDCFDTLIWRATHAPGDVFADLDLPGGAMGPRQWSEGAARRIVQQRGGASEIGLADVYRHLLPNADDAAVAAAVATELAHEARHAFAFAPTVALMREAKRRGLAVILVSDMYLTETQLRAHVAAAAGDEVLALVDRVFVSHEHGHGKVDGLFDHVLAAMKVAPDAILHVGDNRAADYDAAIRHGLNAVHLEQFDRATETRLRHEAIAATLIDPQARVNRPVMQPHRAAVALRQTDDPAQILGHDVIGPVMHGFALWVKGELDAMAARIGRPVRPLFVMRDGHLPMAAFAALFPDHGAAGVEISRFVATRASLADERALDIYLADWLKRLPLATLARQMMLSREDIAAIERIGDRRRAETAFVTLIRRPDVRRKILRRADGFVTRLEAHLAQAGVGRGDAVMLVDLGYNGTVQNLIAPVLERRLELTVAGRYLLLREGQLSGRDKSGFLDVRHYDARALHAIAANVALLEQLSNVAQGSTVDFTPDGTPIREQPDMKGEQSVVRDAVQAACLDYVRAGDVGIHRAAVSDDLDARRQAAAAALTRLFFMPREAEAALFASFAFDPNMGTNAATLLFDAGGATQRLRRFGLPYLNTSEAMFVPAELHDKGLPLALTLFASSRFSMDLRDADFDVGGVPVPVILLSETGGAIVEHIAYPTIDGFYRLDIAVGEARFVPGVQLGQLCAWVQVEETSYRSAIPRDGEVGPCRAIASIADGMETMAPGLYRASPAGLLMIPPPPSSEPLVLTLVFRPIQWRADAGAVAQAA